MTTSTERLKMPGTKTAPTVDGTGFQWKSVSMTFYDYTGEQRTVTVRVDSDATPAEIDALVSAMQVMSNATIWRVTVSDVYNSVGDPSNAVESVWEEASANIVLLAKDTTDQSSNLFIPAPVNDAFVEGTEEINPAYVPLANTLTAWLAMKTGYNVVSGRFTQRRDIGTKINF
jgi:hypothetical protein